jgi:Domain of unknown function (DUF4145)
MNAFIGEAKMAEAEILVTCGHCSNRENCKVKADSIQDLTDEDEHFVTTWYTLECPACSGLILQQTYLESGWPVGEEQIRILYPASRERLTGLPVEIAKEYEASLKVQRISSDACAVLARRTLEAILTHENATGNTLEKKVDSLLMSARIPQLLADVAHLGRKIGNMGSHFEKGEAVSDEDVAIMLDFLETILEYLYVIPAQVNYVKARLSKTPFDPDEADLYKR